MVANEASRLATVEPYRRKIRYWDVDSNAHVFNARYFVYFDDALTDFFDEAGLDFGALGGDGPVWVTAHAACDFKGEANVGDVLATSVEVESIGNTSVTFALTTLDETTGRTVATGKEVYVIIERETRKPIPVSDSIRRLLAPHMPG